MRSLLVLVVIIIAASLHAPAQSFKLVGTTLLDSKELLAHSRTIPTEFVLANKKTAGKFYAVDVYEILKPQLKSLTPADLRRTIIVAESSTGEVTTFSAAEVQPETSKLPAMLVLSPIATKGGIISIQDSALNRGRVDLSTLDAAFGATIRRKVGLQLQSAKSPTIAPYSIIFPIDARIDRWLNDVKLLKIYIVTP